MKHYSNQLNKIKTQILKIIDNIIIFSGLIIVLNS